MSMTDSRSLRDMDDLRLGRNLRALWEAVRWPEYDGIGIALHLRVGETQPTVQIWHHESLRMHTSHDLDMALRDAAEDATAWIAAHPREAPKGKREKEEGKSNE